jgi:hypothetical protein
MTREMGSLGKDVAGGLAAVARLPLVHHEIIDSLADKMRLRKSHVVRLLDGQRRASSSASPPTRPASRSTPRTELCTCACAAGRGDPRLGRHPPASRACRTSLSVRVCAPLELRKQRMMERLRTHDEDVRRRGDPRSDEAQSAIMRRYFNVDWTDSSHYDLVLNTERVSVADCIDVVAQAGALDRVQRDRRLAPRAARRRAAKPGARRAARRPAHARACASVVSGERGVQPERPGDDEDQKPAAVAGRPRSGRQRGEPCATSRAAPAASAPGKAALLDPPSGGY